jgi:hypothetical protein
MGTKHIDRYVIQFFSIPVFFSHCRYPVFPIAA